MCDHENDSSIVSHGEKLVDESSSQHRNMTHKILRSTDGEDVKCSSRLFHIKKCIKMCDRHTKKSMILHAMVVLLFITVTCFAALNCGLPKTKSCAAGIWNWNSQHHFYHEKNFIHKFSNFSKFNTEVKVKSFDNFSDWIISEIKFENFEKKSWIDMLQIFGKETNDLVENTWS